MRAILVQVRMMSGMVSMSSLVVNIMIDHHIEVFKNHLKLIYHIFNVYNLI